MYNYENKKLIEKHVNYTYILMNEVELRRELKSWNRQNLIDWLNWNDPNGVYKDDQSIDELGAIMTYDEGVEIMINQIFEKNA